MLIKKFESFEERDIVSFDFDGVIHRSVFPGTIHPINFDQPDTWQPFEMMHQAIRKEHANGNKVIVVTARDSWNAKEVEAYVKKYDLPIEEFIYTDNAPKLPYIVASMSIRHYDDSPMLKQGLKKHGIEFYLVDPIKQTLKKC